MPGIPSDEVRENGSVVRHRFTRVGGQLIGSKSVMTLVYMFEYVNFRDKDDLEPSGPALLRTYITKQFNEGVASYKESTFEGHPACAYTTKSGSGRVDGRAVLVRNRLYHMVAAGPVEMFDPSRPYAGDVINFLLSFRLLR